MSPAPAVTAVIAAAGSGERLGAGGPKAFVPLAGRPMVEWSIDAFRACEAVAAIVVAVPPSLLEAGAGPGAAGEANTGAGAPTEAGAHPALLLERREAAVGAGVEVLAGGSSRGESVANALALVETELVAIHDAARPLLTPGLVDALTAALAANPAAAGAIPAAPITDTVKRVKRADRSKTAFPPHSDGNAVFDIEETLDRSELWGAHTPQLFRTDVLRAALAGELEATDEAMLVERAGGRVLIVPNGAENLKVTTPLDLEVAELLLAKRPGPGAPD